MTEPDEPANLPALATHQGGALVSVLQWPQYLEVLNRTQQTQIAILVRSFPDLNTETGVDMLADAMTFYGVRFDSWFAELLDTHGIENITMMLEILREYSVVGGVDDIVDPENYRRKGAPTGQDDRERLELERGLELLAWLRNLDQTVETFEQCERLLERLGGWEVARLLDFDHLEAFFGGQMDIRELRELAEAPQQRYDGDEDDE